MKIYLTLFSFLIQQSFTISPLTCADVTDSTDCKDIINGINQCKWVNNTCVSMKCELLISPCDGQIYDKKACSTSGTTCVTVTDCSQIDNQNSCTSVKAGGKDCIWDTTCRMKQCSDYTSTTCISSNGDYCVFKDNICQLVKECTDITDSTTCGKIDLDKPCLWANGKCNIFDCSLITTSYDCNQLIIDSDSCFDASQESTTVNCQSCKKFTTQCNCLQYALYGCNWDVSKESCYRQKCEDYIDVTTCAAAFDGLTCTWYTPLDACTSFSKANELDRQCDLYVYGEVLVLAFLTILINL